ncbi:hypothetical protein [Actinophytocola sp.]|uniref:hypothetical protein n=1 Tax=Actinophytocola sp. TaxID=1872138 RepID=UPI00389AF51C
MTDLRTLHDAFAELERRADAASAGALSTAPGPRRALGLRLVPVAATVVAVAGLAAGAMWLVPGGNTGAAAGGPPTTTTVATAAPTTEPAVPSTTEDLANRFRRVLGNTATFEVSDSGGVGVEEHPPSGGPRSVPGSAETNTSGPSVPTTSVTTRSNDDAIGNGVVIRGTLTAAGVTGGFDLQMYGMDPGAGVWCDDPDRSTCTQSTLPDGTKLAIGQEPLQETGGITYLLNVVRPDGTVILMHLSNMGDAKGAGGVLAPQPPLTTEQLKAIAASDRW